MLAADPLLGTVIAGHRIEAVIGKGGMGSVYLARHQRLDKARAIKLLPPHLAEDARFRDRFEREWRAAAAIEHPSIVEVFDAGEQDGRLYIVMRYVDGVDLQQAIVREGPLGLERALTVLEQVAGALDAAHFHGLIHRDVKPSNILLGSDHRAYLSDFGIAKSSSTRGVTKTGLFVGTVDYASPEQIEGKPLDGRTDVYALGGVLYSCVTGAPPYERDTDAQVMLAKLQGPVPRPSEKRPELPAGLDDVIGRAMAKSVDDRYETCGEFASHVRNLLSQTGRGPVALSAHDVETVPDRGLDAGLAPFAATELASVPLPDTIASQREPLPASPDAAERRRLPPSRRSVLVGALAAVVLLGATAAGAAILFGGGSDTVPLAGLVLDSSSNKPVEGVRVETAAANGVTGADGRFALGEVPRDAEVSLTSCAYAPRRLAVSALAGEQPLRLKPLPVQGTIQSALTGRPLVATVRDGGLSAKSGTNGRYLLSGSCSGRTLEFSAPGYLAQSAEVGSDRRASVVLTTPKKVRETFSNVGNWFSGAGQALGGAAQGWSAFVAGGAYHVRVTKTNWDAGAAAADFDPGTKGKTITRSRVRPTDVSLTVETQKIAGTDGSTSAGVACSGDDVAYEFVVGSDGYYRLDREDANGKRKELVAWRRSSRIRSGGATNRVSVQCRGGRPVRLRLAVNGSTLIVAEDDARRSGFQYVYLYATSYETAPIEVAFDNLVFSRDS